MNAASHFNNLEYFEELTRGSEAAFRKIFHYYYPQLTAHVFKITHTEYTAEEITQEVFLRLWLKRFEFTDTTELKSWLYKVASNLAFDHLKKQAHHHKLLRFYQEQVVTADDIESQLDLKESKKNIAAAVQQLPEQQKLIYKLSREEGLSHQEIAEKLGLSRSTVKNHMVKAMQTLRKAVNRTAYLLFCQFF